MRRYSFKLHELNVMDKHNEHNYQFMYVLGLVVVAMFWGLGFPALKFCENIPTFFIMSVRFALAAILTSIVFWKKLRLINKEYIKVGIWLGVLMFACYIAATIGIKYTTSSRCAFFSCLGAICVPLINLIFYKIKITGKFFVCMAICVVGVYLISMGGSGEIGLSMGDVICLTASIFGAAQLIELEKKGQNMDIVALTVVEQIVIAVLSFAGMFIAGEAVPASFSGIEIASLLFMGICATAIAFLLQFICIKKVPSNRASLILTLEPVIGAISSVLILGDALGWQGYVGGLTIVVSIVFSEWSSDTDSGSADSNSGSGMGSGSAITND